MADVGQCRAVVHSRLPRPVSLVSAWHARVVANERTEPRYRDLGVLEMYAG